MGATRALLVTGPAGSGKSTLAAAVAGRVGAALLDQDVLTNPLVVIVADLLGAGDDIDRPRLRALVRDARYAVLLDVAEAQLALGLDVVVVAPFTAEVSGTQAWAGLNTRLIAAGAGLVELVWLDAPASLLVERLTRRGAARDRAKLTDERALQQFLGGLRPPTVPAIRVDAELPLDAQIAAVLDALD